MIDTNQETITELGLASQRKNQPHVCRHFIVQSTQNTKSRPPLPAGFGIVSENIGRPQQLYDMLEDFFQSCWCENSRVVLTGFEIKGDLMEIEKSCG